MLHQITGRMTPEETSNVRAQLATLTANLNQLSARTAALTAAFDACNGALVSGEKAV